MPAFLEALKVDAAGSREEEGCLRFDLLKDSEAANTWHFYEIYKDNDAMAVHKTLPHYKAWADFKAGFAASSWLPSRLRCSSPRRGLAREEPSTRPTKRRLVASTKGATGHLLGAAGALEACFAALALRDGLAPATAHLAAPLPTSERINLVAEATRRDLRVALSTSSGFGGTNAALVFARADVSGDLGVEARARVPLG